MTNLLSSVDETRRALGGVSRTTVYDLVRRQELELVKVGRRSFITVESLNRYVERLVAQGSGLAS